MKFHMLSAAVGAVSAGALVLLAGFHVPQEDDDDAFVQALQELTTAQERQAMALERQAAAWELAAKRELPAPQVYQLTGSVPSNLDVTLSGAVRIDQGRGQGPGWQVLVY